MMVFYLDKFGYCHKRTPNQILAKRAKIPLNYARNEAGIQGLHLDRAGEMI